MLKAISLLINRVERTLNSRTVSTFIKNRLRDGDVLVITSIDRLGRNYRDIMEQWKHITQNLKVDIKVLDTRSRQRQLIDIMPIVVNADYF